MRFKVVSVILLYFYLNVCNGSVTAFRPKVSHKVASLREEDFSAVAGLSDEVLFNQTLSNIAIPRVMGSRGHDVVKKFIVDSMTNLSWSVELDSFSQDTVVGNVLFENIIATLDPKAHRHLVLACHYDSKMDREKAWVLATDSAVPCSMMINLAQLLQPQLNQHFAQGNEVTLQFVFFDGEEAFRDWSATDSIYGARHLAHKLSTTPYPPNNSQKTTHLHRMDVLVLLDLLGARKPTFRNFFSDTAELYQKMQEIEQNLNTLNLIKTNPEPYFTNNFAFGGVEDDHIPFLEKGVPILHLIPVPFPDVWHTARDTVDNLDFPTIDNLNKIFRCFVSSYLNLNNSSRRHA